MVMPKFMSIILRYKTFKRSLVLFEMIITKLKSFQDNNSSSL